MPVEKGNELLTANFQIYSKSSTDLSINCRQIATKYL